MALEAGTKLGPYEILSPIGAGGMGEVYRARDTTLGREVAIKVLPADVASSPERSQRFEREAKTVATLNHPNIVTIHGIHNENDQRFIAMELVEGDTLDRLGRSMIETIKTIQELMALKIRIVVTTQGLTFDQSPYSIFLIQLFAALAELESNHASERIKAGLAVARANVKKLGRRIDEEKRAKLLRWQEAKLPVIEQARRLGVTSAAVYAMRQRSRQNRSGCAPS